MFEPAIINDDVCMLLQYLRPGFDIRIRIDMTSQIIINSETFQKLIEREREGRGGEGKPSNCSERFHEHRKTKAAKQQATTQATNRQTTLTLHHSKLTTLQPALSL